VAGSKCVAAIREISVIADAAKAPSAETGISATVEKPTITKTGAAKTSAAKSAEPTAAVESAQPATTKPAVESAEAAKTCRNFLAGYCEKHRHCRAGDRNCGQFLHDWKFSHVREAPLTT
jgi:hypothetical protein